MFKFYNLLSEKTPALNKLSIFLTTFVSLIVFNSSTSIKAETINSNHKTQVTFYGTAQNPTAIGAEYLLFKDYNKSVRGLVYVQNSDVFSCFQGDFDRQNKSLQNMIFAYPTMDDNEWVQNELGEKISLENFPHQLNYVDVNENTKQLFNQCLQYFANS